MEILHIGKREQALDTYERFHINEISKQNTQLKDNFTETFNRIYDVIIAVHQAKTITLPPIPSIHNLPLPPPPPT
jgi:hypothetical protein